MRSTIGPLLGLSFALVASSLAQSLPASHNDDSLNPSAEPIRFSEVTAFDARIAESRTRFLRASSVFPNKASAESDQNQFATSKSSSASHSRRHAVVLNSHNHDWQSPTLFYPDEQRAETTASRDDVLTSDDADEFSPLKIWEPRELSFLASKPLLFSRSPENLLSVSFERLAILSLDPSEVESILTTGIRRWESDLTEMLSLWTKADSGRAEATGLGTGTNLTAFSSR